MPNDGSVIVVNVLLGWTVVGWIIALAMACRSKPVLGTNRFLEHLLFAVAVDLADTA